MKRYLLALGLLFVPGLALAQTTTPCLQMTLPVPLSPATNNVWGQTVNNNFSILDATQNGILTLDLTAQGSLLVLSSTKGDATAQALRGHFQFNGTPAGAITVLWPKGLCRAFSAYNNTTQTLTLGANNGLGAVAGATVALPPGYTALATSNGIDVLAPPAVTSTVALPGLPSNQIWVGSGGGVATPTSAGGVGTLLAVSQSWSPALTVNGSAAGIAYVGQTGHYVTVGNLTIADFWLQLSAKGAGTGTVRLVGLPAAGAGVTGGTCVVGNFSGMATISGQILGQIAPSGTTAVLYQGGAAASAALTDVNLTSGSVLFGTCQYVN